MFLRNMADSFMGGNNPSDAAMPYFNQIPDILKQYYAPYAEAGQRQIPGLENEYGKLMENPGGFVNEIGKGYQESPGFQFALQNALQGINHKGNAAGMGGSPAYNQWSMETATNLANQDYGNWLQRALGAYDRGLGGKENLFKTGAGAAGSLGENLSSNLMNQGGLAFQGQANQNQMNSDMLANAIKLAMMGAML